eukprot:scaffold52748_cov60-Phaeocystis_antarctica.AAC.7
MPHPSWPTSPSSMPHRPRTQGKRSSRPQAGLLLTRASLALDSLRLMPETIAGVDELLPEHRAWVVAALSGLPVGPTPIRATPPTKAEIKAEAKAEARAAAAAIESDP